jgi:hypothetical protein
MYVSIVFLHSVCSADGNLLVVTVVLSVIRSSLAIH